MLHTHIAASVTTYCWRSAICAVAVHVTRQVLLALLLHRRCDVSVSTRRKTTVGRSRQQVKCHSDYSYSLFAVWPWLSSAFCRRSTWPQRSRFSSLQPCCWNSTQFCRLSPRSCVVVASHWPADRGAGPLLLLLPNVAERASRDLIWISIQVTWEHKISAITILLSL